MPESPMKRVSKEVSPWKEQAAASVCHSDVPCEDSSVALPPVTHLSFECLTAVSAKSRDAQMPPFTTLGIYVMSQVPPPDKLQQGGTRRDLKNIIWSSPLHQDRIKYSFKSIPGEYLPTRFEEALMKEAPYPPTYANPFQYIASPTVRKYS
ncbi:hypothetical protein BTVI_82465 [Pitangus sulphuratus]|nr:hypothetical protein BTVI_82465 [Pitangus sulphuratus]